ncbi:glycosyltransferase family 2 protein [Spirosoma pollinicola]|uniref:Glycosyl transferase family 2 n=1 Tax=Spirosoma pollinicola TaxID=2057025 RepID=A0A2K8ZAF3_9BACT|nr:glycosyltransferase family 2 protein [Spirosoma pollinicola]AUD06858.1 glycosyl transferase family 2 [Spirosoma pollinicola]
MRKRTAITTCSVLVATYNRPDALTHCLNSLFRQSRLPNEIIVCDDGSRDETRQVILALQVRSPVPLLHIWQADQGFKLAQIRNKGIAMATGSYLIQIDGDVILHPQFVADQLRVAKAGSFYSGNQFLLTQQQTNQLLANPRTHSPTSLKQIRLTWHRMWVPFLQKPFARFYHWNEHYRYVIGCNMAFWRADLLAVNGYDERFTGWGWEDTDLAIRLIQLGRRLRFIRFGAIQYHLYHSPSSRSDEEPNRLQALANRDAHVVYCQTGLAQYLSVVSLGNDYSTLPP